MTSTTAREAPADDLRRFHLQAPLPPLWRAPGILQVGPEGPVLHDVPAGVATLVTALASPRSRRNLARVSGLPSAWVDWVLCELSAVGLLRRPGARPHFRLVGHGELAEQIAVALLNASEARLTLCDSPGSPAGTADASGMAQRLTGGHPGRVDVGDLGDPSLTRRLTSPQAASEALTVLAVDTCQPCRSSTDHLVGQGIPHLVVRLEAGAGVVGPLVLPGRTPCVRCLDLHRARCDPAWPRVLAQLVQVRGRADRLTREWAVTTACLHALSFASGGLPDTLGHTLELGPDGVVRVRELPWHPECGCQEPDR